MNCFYFILLIIPLIKSDKCCSNNSITNLICERLNLKTIPVCEYQLHIQQLSLAFNEVTHLSNSSYINYSYLEEIKLNNNKMVSIAGNAFEGMPNLRVLFLNNNLLKSIPYDVFSNLKKLSTIYLHHNKFLAIPAISNPSLSRLLLNNNLINSIFFPISFSKCVKLKRIDLKHNYIKNPKINELSNLKNLQIESLLLNNNGIENVATNIFYHIRRFIRSIDIRDNPKLGNVGFEKVIGSFNHTRHKKSWHLDIFALNVGLTKIANETFMSFKGVFLQSLDLSKNLISEMETNFEMLRDLLKMLLNNNRLKFIPNSQFSGLRKLRLLQIRNNLIRGIDNGAFRGLSRLETLDLKNNKISNMNSFVLNPLVSLKKLLLVGNPILILSACSPNNRINTNIESDWPMRKVIANNSLCFSDSTCDVVIKKNYDFNFQLDINLSYCSTLVTKSNDNRMPVSFVFKNKEFDVSHLKIVHPMKNKSEYIMTVAISIPVFAVLITLFAASIHYRKNFNCKWLKTRFSVKRKARIKRSIDSENKYESISDVLYLQDLKVIEEKLSTA